MKATVVGPRRPSALIPFFFLSYLFSWSIAVPLALQAEGLIRSQIPFSLHYLAAYGPLLAALLVTGVSDGRHGLQHLLARLVDWRIRWRWWLVALAPLLLFALVAALLSLISGQTMTLAALGDLKFLPSLGFLSLPLWFLTFGIGEEMGWRGFALSRLHADRGPLTATVILWFFWALWHLPFFFYSYDAIFLPGFLLGLLAGSVVLTWLYNGSGGSVLLVAVWHSLFNYATACTSCSAGSGASLLSAIVIVWAVVLALRSAPWRGTDHPAGDAKPGESIP